MSTTYYIVLGAIAVVLIVFLVWYRKKNA